MKKLSSIACSTFVGFLCLSPIVSIASPKLATYYNGSSVVIQHQFKDVPVGYCNNAWIQPGGSQQCSLAPFKVLLQTDFAGSPFPRFVYPTSQTVSGHCTGGEEGSTSAGYIFPSKGVSKITIKTNSDSVMVTCPGNSSCSQTDGSPHANYEVNIQCE
jgi:hypothetical protein